MVTVSRLNVLNMVVTGLEDIEYGSYRSWGWDLKNGVQFCQNKEWIITTQKSINMKVYKTMMSM